MPSPKDPEARKLWKERLSKSLLGRGRICECHPERKHFARGLCKRCYWSKVANKTYNSRKRQAIWDKKTKQSLKKEIFTLLGNMCRKCRFSDERALQIDHVNGGGKVHRAELGAGKRYYRTIKAELLSGSIDYQLLCANCNWIKRTENNEVRKSKHGI